MESDKINKITIIAGLVVAGSILAFSQNKKIKCANQKGIYDPDNGPLFITDEAIDDITDSARKKIKALIISKDSNTDLSDIKLQVANSIRECDWESLKTAEQKIVWNAISNIVNSVNENAISNTDDFLNSF